MKLSVIVAFRNRDLIRVERYLNSLQNQTFIDFELIFIDYGSETELSIALKNLTEKYNFCNYVYNHTQRWVWNRAHALNTGVKLAKGEYVLFSDVDLIYSENFLHFIEKALKPDTQLFQQVYWLPEKFDNWNSLVNKPTEFDYSLDGSRGGVHVLPINILKEINGYDEFYCFWGFEDNDIHRRLEIKGLKEEWLNREEAPVYHQWHPIVSNQKSYFFPEKWYEQMLLYYHVNKDKIVRNENGWGKLYQKNDRLLFNKTSKKQLKLPSKIVLNSKSDITLDLISEINNLKNDKYLFIEIPIPQKPEKYQGGIIYSVFQKLTQLVLKKRVIVSNDYIVFLERISRERAEMLVPEFDIYYIVWQLIKSDKLINDYSIQILKQKILISIC